MVQKSESTSEHFQFNMQLPLKAWGLWDLDFLFLLLTKTAFIWSKIQKKSNIVKYYYN